MKKFFKAFKIVFLVLCLIIAVNACSQMTTAYSDCPTLKSHCFVPTCVPNYWYITYTWVTHEDDGQDRIKITTPCSSYCMDATHSGTRTIGPYLITDTSKVSFQGYMGNDCHGDPCLMHNLPVAIASFAGRRDGAQVRLVWETASEQNNQGFNVQRFEQSRWNSVSFVPTQAADGNSESVVRYVYTEQFPSTAAVQYRLEQSDRDGKKTYSSVIAVPGSNNLPATAYCNSNGVMLMFPNLSIHQVMLVDILGREQQRVKQSGTIYLSNIRPGIYALRIFDELGAFQETKRIVMK